MASPRDGPANCELVIAEEPAGGSVRAEQREPHRHLGAAFWP
jgi:hypothetical protein